MKDLSKKKKNIRKKTTLRGKGKHRIGSMGTEKVKLRMEELRRSNEECEEKRKDKLEIKVKALKKGRL